MSALEYSLGVAVDLTGVEIDELPIFNAKVVNNYRGNTVFVFNHKLVFPCFLLTRSFSLSSSLLTLLYFLAGNRSLLRMRGLEP